MSHVVLGAYGAGALGQVLSQLYFFFILKLLSAEQVGVYSWALAITSLYVYITDFGLTPFLVSEIPRQRYGLREVLGVILTVRLFPGIVALVLILLWKTFDQPTGVELAVLGLMASAQFGQLLEWGIVSWLQVGRRQNLVNLLSVVTPAGRVIGVLLVLWLRIDAALINFVVILVITQFVSLSIHAVMALRDSLCNATFRLPHAGLLVQFRGRVWRLTGLYALMAGQARLDWLLVSALLTKVALANYAVANKLVDFVTLGAGILAKTAYPWIAQAECQDNAVRPVLLLLERIFVLSIGVVSMLLVLWAPPLIQMLFGAKYDAAIPAVKVMASLTSVFMLNNYFLYVLLGKNAETSYVTILAVATVAQIGVDLVLLPRLGIVGAAIGMTVMGLIVHAGQLALLIKFGWLRTREVIRMEAFVAVVILLTIVASLGRLQPLWGSVATVCIVIAAGMFLLLTQSDRQQIRARLWFDARVPDGV